MTRSSKLVVYLPYPPTANNLFPTGKSGRRFISAEYKAWKLHAGLALNPQIAGLRLPLEGPHKLWSSFRKPDNRRRDCSNLEKAIGDLLVTHGVIADDCDIYRNTQEWAFDVPWEARVTITPWRP